MLTIPDKFVIIYIDTNFEREDNMFNNPKYQKNDNFRNRQRRVDFGPDPFVINIERATKANKNYRSALWTGDYLQLTLMSIEPGKDIGLEVHNDLDQFIRIEQGEGVVMMGDSKRNLNFKHKVYNESIVIIPAGKWHNLVNTGFAPIKLYSIYAPPEHPHGTIHRTKADAENYH